MARDYKACDWKTKNNKILLAGDATKMDAWGGENSANCRLSKRNDYFRVPFNCADCEQRRQAMGTQKAATTQGCAEDKEGETGAMLHDNLPYRSRQSGDRANDL